MPVLIDNDALLKLAQYDLLESGLAAFGIAREDVRVLHTAKYALLPAKNRLKRCKTEDCAVRLEAFLSSIPPIEEDAGSPDEFDALNGHPSIDAGEARLFAAAASGQETIVITGDKRALAALGEATEFADLKTRLSGKILSLELFFRFLIEVDFASTQISVRRQPGVDKALTIAFGTSHPAPIASVQEALDSYVKHLQGTVGDLLHPPPS